MSCPTLRARPLAAIKAVAVPTDLGPREGGRREGARCEGHESTEGSYIGSFYSERRERERERELC